MLAGLIAPRLRLGFVSASSRLCLSYVSTTHRLHLDYALASISCEHCRSSHNNPHCAPRHVIYYCNFFVLIAWEWNCLLNVLQKLKFRRHKHTYSFELRYWEHLKGSHLSDYLLCSNLCEWCMCVSVSARIKLFTSWLKILQVKNEQIYFTVDTIRKKICRNNQNK